MSAYKARLVPHGFYHIFNRAHGNEQMFLSNDNYLYFLKRFNEVVGPYVHLHCYCLMPNHFHFLIEIKSEKEISLPHPRGLIDLEGVAEDFDKFLIQQFSNFFNGYTKAFNKQHGRLGGLFMSPFRRVAVTDERYRLVLVKYIHFNPVDAGLSFLPSKWKYSSYNHLFELGKNNQQHVVFEWFDDYTNFIAFHSFR